MALSRRWRVEAPLNAAQEGVATKVGSGSLRRRRCGPIALKGTRDRRLGAGGAPRFTQSLPPSCRSAWHSAGAQGPSPTERGHKGVAAQIGAASPRPSPLRANRLKAVRDRLEAAPRAWSSQTLGFPFLGGVCGVPRGGPRPSIGRTYSALPNSIVLASGGAGLLHPQNNFARAGRITFARDPHRRHPCGCRRSASAPRSRPCPGELGGRRADIAIGLIERSRDRCMPQSMGAYDPPELRAHRFPGSCGRHRRTRRRAGQYPGPPLCRVGERAGPGLLAAQRHPSPQFGRVTRGSSGQPLALPRLPLRNTLTRLAPRIKVAPSLARRPSPPAQGPAVAQKQKNIATSRAGLGFVGGEASRPPG